MITIITALRIRNSQDKSQLGVLGRHQQLIRLDFEQDFHELVKDNLLSAYDHFLLQVEAVIFRLW